MKISASPRPAYFGPPPAYPRDETTSHAHGAFGARVAQLEPLAEAGTGAVRDAIQVDARRAASCHAQCQRRDERGRFIRQRGARAAK
jgi:hypothetical protein